MTTFFYDAQGHDREVELSRDAITSVEDHQLIWIDLLRSDTDKISLASDLLSVSFEAVCLLGQGGQSKQLDSFETHFQFSLPVAPGPTGHSERVDYLVGNRWLMTVRDGDVPYFEDFRAQDRGESLSGRLTPAALTASLLDWHLEAYRSEISTVEKLIDRIDEAVLEAREKRPPLGALAKLRGRVGLLRSRLDEHRPIIRGMLRSDFFHISGHAHAEHFFSLERHFERTEDMINRSQAIIVGSFDLYATRTAQDTNQLVKRLTVVTVSMGLAEVIATIFSMNFDLPFTNTGVTGFSIVVGAMVAVAGLSWLFAVWRRWV